MPSSLTVTDKYFPFQPEVESKRTEIKTSVYNPMYVASAENLKNNGCCIRAKLGKFIIF